MKNCFLKIYDVFCFKKEIEKDIPHYESRIQKKSLISENETNSNNSYEIRSLTKDQMLKTESGWNDKNSNQLNNELSTKHKNDPKKNLNEILEEKTKKLKKKKNVYNDSDQELSTKNDQENEKYLNRPKKSNENETQKFSNIKIEEKKKKIDSEKEERVKTKKIVRHPEKNLKN